MKAVSEGTVTGRGYFDYVNIGDQVLYPVKKAAERPRCPAAQRTRKHPHAALQDRRVTRHAASGRAGASAALDERPR